MSTLGLVMIVRDEAPIIERCVEAARPVIDHWTIVDTGSVDGTRELVERSLDGVPGALHAATWVDFGTNRTEAIRLARGTADYLLLLDADDVLLAVPGFTVEPGQLVYMVEIIDGGDLYYTPRIVRADHPWFYRGSTHEYLTSDEVPVPVGPVAAGVSIRHYCDGSRRPRKFAEDELLLRAWLERNPGDPRATFYLANTLRDLGRHDEAVPLYRQRALMGGWPAEAELAARQAALLELGDTTVVGVPSPV